METNILRILILIILFFLLTCEYSTFISKLLSDDNNETEAISDVNKPKPLSRRSKEKSYSEISLSDVINADEESEDEDEDEETESDKEPRKSKCKYNIKIQHFLLSLAGERRIDIRYGTSFFPFL